MNIISWLCDQLSIPDDDIRSFILSSPHRYKRYQIPKRDGQGMRQIAQPAKQLKFLQKLVYENFFSRLPVHNSVMAYRKGLSIKDNANLHVKNPYLLKMDFKDFFPSIKPDDFVNHLRTYYDQNLSTDDEFVVRRLFFYCKVRGGQHELSIGAPTSPSISNTILYDLDSAISSTCKAHNVSYTRYADDITFSTREKGLLFLFPEKISKILKNIEHPVLQLNNEKTVFASKKTNRHVTGLVLSNDGVVSIGRDKKRMVRSLIYQYLKGDLAEEKRLFLGGYLSFCSDVEPAFLSSLEEKYGEKTIKDLLSGNY